MPKLLRATPGVFSLGLQACAPEAHCWQPVGSLTTAPPDATGQTRRVTWHQCAACQIVVELGGTYTPDAPAGARFQAQTSWGWLPLQEDPVPLWTQEENP